MSERREELEAECRRLQFLWEEELFSSRPDWQQISQLELELELEGAEGALARQIWEELE